MSSLLNFVRASAIRYILGVNMPLLSCFIENKTVKKNRYVYFIKLASQNVKSARFSVYLPELGPLIRKRVLLPPFGSKRGDTLACGGGRGGDPIPTKGQTLWYSMYTINFYMCLFGDIRNSIHEKSHGIPWNSAEFHGIIRHGIRRNSAGIAANSARNTE